MKNRATLCLVLLFLLTATLPEALAVAQEGRASISGIVSDQSGAPAPGAIVTVTSIERNTLSSTISGETGNYLVLFLLPGTYRVTVELPGFKKFVQENLLLRVDDKARVDAVLEVGGSSESVVVESKGGLLETETATRGQVITSQQIADLPNNGRNIFQLVWAVPGVIKTSTYWGSMENYALGNASAVSINGGKQKENETLLDGTTDTVANRDVNFQPPLESVKEFKVHTGVYDAQYGRTGGGVTTIVSKSGTNAFHGSVYEFNKVDALGANPWVLNYLGIPKPHFVNNTFGFEVDGPIYIPKLFDGRNKLFFMVSYEGLRERSSGGDSALLPTDAQRNGDFSATPRTIYDPTTTKTVGGQIVREPFLGNKIPDNYISPVAKKVLEFIPKPNRVTSDPFDDNYAVGLGAKNGYNEVLARLDYAINPKNTVYVRHGRLPYEEFDDILFGGGNPAEPSRENPLHRNFYNWSADWTSVLSPITVLDLRAGLARYVNTGGSPPAAYFDPRKLGFADSLVSQFTFLHFPRFELGQYTVIGSDRIISKDVNDAYSYHANLNRVQGRHQLKTGAEFRLYNQNTISPGLASGRYTFSKVFTQRDPSRGDAVSGDEFAAFMLGYPSGGSVDVNIDTAFQNDYYALFVQDDWKMTPRISLNFGLRWDYERPPTERFDRMTRGFAFNEPHPLAGQVPALNLKGGIIFVDSNNRRAFNADKNNFQPRVGFAYRIGEKWVVRGGYGVFYLGAHERGGTDGYSSPTTLVASLDSNLTPRVTLVNAFPEGLLRPKGNSLGRNTNVGLNIGTVFLDRPLPYSHQLSLGIQRELPGQWVVEAAYSANFSRRLPVSANNINVLPVSELGKEITYYTTRVNNPMAGLIPNNAALNGATIPRERLLALFPHYGAITVGSIPIGKQDYHSMQSRLTKRFSGGVSMLVAYTLSKNLEQVSFLNNQDFNLNDPDSSRLEKRLTQFDAPQKLAVLLTAELPFGRNKRFGSGVSPVIDKLIGGWQINLDATLQTGFPAGYPNAAQQEGRSAKLPSDKIDLFHAFDTTIFPRTLPDLTHNLRNFPTRFPDVRLQPLQNVDFSVYKNTPLTERVRFQVRVEFLNAFNHPWFASLHSNGLNVTSSQFGWYRLEETNQNRLIALVAKILW